MVSRDTTAMVICNSFSYKMRFLTCMYFIIFFYVIFKCLLRSKIKMINSLEEKFIPFLVIPWSHFNHNQHFP